MLAVSLAQPLLLPSVTHAQEAATAKDWTLNLRDVDISVFLEQVSAITGENFVVDPQAKGKVSIIATTPMKADAVKELLLTVLRVNGLSAIPSGTATRIVPQANTKLAHGSTLSSGSQLITRVIPVRNANISDVVRVLKPLVSQAGYLEGSEFSNALIVSDYSDNVAQIGKALASLDKQQNVSDVEIIPLKEAWVGNIVPLLEAIAPMQIADSGKGLNSLRVVADERSNSIIVRGDSKQREQVRELVRKFDVRNNEGSNIQMIHLQYADAREVAALLRGMLNNKPSQPVQLAATPATQTGSATTATPAASAATPAAASLSPDDSTDTQSSIQANVTLNTIIVRAQPAMMSEIRALVKQLDVRRPQVLIEAAIVEITADKSKQLGVQLAGGKSAVTYNGATTEFANAGLAMGDVLTQLGNVNGGALSNEGLAVTLGTKAGFSVLLQALSSTSGANLLSTPSIITLDNEEAKIVVGQNVPFRTGSFSTQNSGVTNPFTTIERQDIGITLKVVPQIHEGNLVKMNIEQEVSSIAPTTVQTSGAADLVTNKRTIQTKVLAEDGETIVLGGLIEDDTSEVESKVPLLGDIPIVGTLFSNKNHSSTKKNLLVFLRPTVLRGREQMATVTQDHYNRVYDLVLGRRDLSDTDAMALPPAQPAPDASSIFNAPPKQLPWLISGAGKPQPHPALPPVQPAAAVLPVAQTEPVALPWSASPVPTLPPSPAAPVLPVEAAPIAQAPHLTLTPPK